MTLLSLPCLSLHVKIKLHLAFGTRFCLAEGWRVWPWCRTGQKRWGEEGLGMWSSSSVKQVQPKYVCCIDEKTQRKLRACVRCSHPAVIAGNNWSFAFSRGVDDESVRCKRCQESCVLHLHRLEEVSIAGLGAFVALEPRFQRLASKRPNHSRYIAPCACRRSLWALGGGSLFQADEKRQYKFAKGQQSSWTGACLIRHLTRVLGSESLFFRLYYHTEAFAVYFPLFQSHLLPCTPEGV